MKLSRLVFPALLGLAAYYAVFGGEYSWFELRDTRDRIETESEELAVLRSEIDSLRAWADSLETDSAALERLARERFGMIRDGEVLYRFVEPRDTTAGEGAEGAEGDGRDGEDGGAGGG